jgi:prepilin signal peptidase PulO-like enzyme (type II secretory pathway)
VLLCVVFWGEPQVWLMPIAAFVAVIAADVDWRTRRIPNTLTGGGLAAATIVAVPLVVTGDVSAWSMLSGAALMSGPLLATHLLTRSRMPGLGDVKLAFVLGGLIGSVSPVAAYLALLGSLLTGATFGIAYRRRTGGRAFPLGPAISAASVTMLLVFGWWG